LGKWLDESRDCCCMLWIGDKVFLIPHRTLLLSSPTSSQLRNLLMLLSRLLTRSLDLNMLSLARLTLHISGVGHMGSGLLRSYAKINSRPRFWAQAVLAGGGSYSHSRCPWVTDVHDDMTTSKLPCKLPFFPPILPRIWSSWNLEKSCKILHFGNFGGGFQFQFAAQPAKIRFAALHVFVILRCSDIFNSGSVQSVLNVRAHAFLCNMTCEGNANPAYTRRLPSTPHFQSKWLLIRKGAAGGFIPKESNLELKCKGQM